MAVVVEAFDGGFLNGPVHPFDLAVGPGVLHLGEAVLDAVLTAAHVEHVGHVAGGRAVGVTRRERELDAVVGQDRVDPVGDDLDHVIEEGRRRGSPRRSNKSDDRELARAIDGHISGPVFRSATEVRRFHFATVF